MSLLLGGKGSAINTAEPRVLSLQVNQSSYGLAIPRVWGTRRVPSNLLWYGDFTPIAHTETQSSGGKGGGGASSTSTTYTYMAAMAIALCTGTIAGVGKVWAGKTQTTLAALGLTLKTGALGQSVWGHLTANHPTEAVGYSGIAYLANAAFDLGNSPSSPNLNFEVQGERIISSGNGDAAPADIVSDMVTDPVEGLGLASILADMTDYQTWCSAMNLTLSLAATSQQPARDHLAQILKATLADAVWSQGKLRIVPYGDHAVGAWTPNTTPVYDIGEGDLLVPPGHVRKQPADAINRVTVAYSDRDHDYNTVPVTRDDLSAVTQFGARPESLDLGAITRGDMAGMVAEFWRDRNLYIRNSFELRLDERFCRLEPMDLLTLTFWPQSLDHLPVRVVDVEEAEDGELTVTVEEWPFGMTRPTALPTQGTSGYTPEQAIAPGPANAPVIFEAPNSLTAPNLEIWIAASGGIHWGGAAVWVSDDNATYQQVGVISNPARHGTLTSALAAGADPDTTHTLHVETSASRGQLNSGSQADADNLNTLLWVDGELLAYETATLTSPQHYDLTYLRRGAKGTAIAGHSSGAQFTRLDDAVFRYVIPRERIGSGVWIKLQSFNQFGLSLEPLDTVTAYNYTIQGNKPLPPATLTATGGMFQNVLHWTFAAGQIGIDYTEIWGATTNNRASASQLTAQKGPVSNWKHPGLQPAQGWYYWARVIDTSTNASDFYPASSTGGVYAAPSADPTDLLTQLKDAVGLTELVAELAAPIALISTPDTLAMLGGMVAPPADVAGPSPIVVASQAAAESLLNLLVKADSLKAQAQRDKWILDATSTVDPVTGTVTLLATAAITTDVEAHLIATDLTLDGMAGSIISHTSTLGLYGTRITDAETNITQLEGDITLKASSTYVDTTIAAALGAIDPANVATMTQLGAEGLLSALVDGDATRKDALNAAVRMALAETTLSTHSDAISAEAVARTVLFAQVASNAAAITNEQTARANADSAEAALRVSLAATVSGNLATTNAAISNEAIARANADSAEAGLRVALAAVVNNPTTGLATRAAASDVTNLQTLTGDATHGNTALATRTTNLETSVNSGTTGLATRAAASDVTNLQTLTGDATHGNTALASSVSTLTSSVSTAQSTANTGVSNAATAQSTANTAVSDAAAAASTANTVQARLDTGDYAAVKTESSANASAITGIQAKYALKVDVNGHVTGFEIINGGTSGDFVILADKFLICKPDGTGTPKQVLILGTVNGVTALGLDGSLIVDGSIVARHLAVTSLDAITATIGTLRSAASGARLEVTTDVIRVYDSSGTLRVKMGNLA